MRIAMIGQKGAPVRYGGVERHVEELSVQLVKRGHRVLVYTRPYYTPSSKRYHRGIRLISLPSIRTKHLDAISHTFLATLDALRRPVDVIHYHGVGPSLLSWLPRIIKPSVKVVVTFHCIDREHEKWGWLARAFLYLGEWTTLHFPHVTISVSRTIQAYCRDRYGHSTVYIPNGVAAPTPYAHESALQRKFNLKKNGYLLSVTRLVPHKGVHTLIKAYRRTSIDMPLVIVGDSAHTNAYVAKLRRISRGDTRIIFTGSLPGDRLEELFANAYAFIHPSRAEGLPIVLLEAMRSKRPILVSNIEPHREIVEPRPGQRFGYFFQTDRPADLARQLEWIVRHPRATRQVGAASQRYVLNYFPWHRVGLKTDQLYRELKQADATGSLTFRDYPLPA